MFTSTARRTLSKVLPKPLYYDAELVRHFHIKHKLTSHPDSLYVTEAKKHYRKYIWNKCKDTELTHTSKYTAKSPTDYFQSIITLYPQIRRSIETEIVCFGENIVTQKDGHESSCSFNENQSMYSKNKQYYKHLWLITRQEPVQKVCGRPLFNYITKLKNPGPSGSTCHYIQIFFSPI